MLIAVLPSSTQPGNGDSAMGDLAHRQLLAVYCLSRPSWLDNKFGPPYDVDSILILPEVMIVV